MRVTFLFYKVPIKKRLKMTECISNREFEVLQLIAFENTINEIASKLFISTHTVITHRKNIMEKLEVKNTAGMIRKAFEVGLFAT